MDQYITSLNNDDVIKYKSLLQKEIDKQYYI